MGGASGFAPFLFLGRKRKIYRRGSRGAAEGAERREAGLKDQRYG
jgi:hypothetical protein